MTLKERILKLCELLKLEEQLLQKETKVDMDINLLDDIDKCFEALKQEKEKRQRLEKEIDSIRSKLTDLYNDILQEMYDAGLEELRLDLGGEILIINRKGYNLSKKEVRI